MRRKKVKKDIRETAIISFLSLSIFFVLTLLLISNIRIYQRRLLLKEQMKERSEKLLELQDQDNSRVDEWENDEEFMIEKIAREQLLLKKEGEEVVVIQFSEREGDEDAEEEAGALWWNPFTWKLK